MELSEQAKKDIAACAKQAKQAGAVILYAFNNSQLPVTSAPNALGAMMAQEYKVCREKQESKAR